MQLCRKCGQEIIFRHKNGILTPIHIAGACNGRPPYSPDSLRKAVYNRCKRCDQMAYFLQHNGGTVWLDALGPPWPKHKCSDWNVQEEKDLARKAQEAKMLASSIRALTGSKGEGGSNVPVITNAQGNGSVASGSRARPGVQSAMAQRDLNGGQAEYRKCEICSAMVRVSRFLGHMAKAHRVPASAQNGAAGSPVLTISDLDGRNMSLTLADLDQYRKHRLAGAERIRIIDVLKGMISPEVLAAVANDGHCHVFVEGATGEKVSIPLTEIRERKAYIAILFREWHGTSGGAKLKLVVPGHEEKVKHIRQIRKITIRKVVL